jgi:hypothetical protein
MQRMPKPFFLFLFHSRLVIYFFVFCL